MALQLSLGDPVGIDTLWGHHVGIIIGWAADGEPVLAHNSWRHGRAVAERLGDIARGRRVFYRGLPRRVPVDEVVARATDALGSAYSFWSWNCEDFVGHALGLEPRSPQRAFWVGAAAVLAGVAFALPALGRGRGPV